MHILFWILLFSAVLTGCTVKTATDKAHLQTKHYYNQKPSLKYKNIHSPLYREYRSPKGEI